MQVGDQERYVNNLGLKQEQNGRNPEVQHAKGGRAFSEHRPKEQMNQRGRCTNELNESQ